MKQSLWGVLAPCALRNVSLVTDCIALLSPDWSVTACWELHSPEHVQYFPHQSPVTELLALSCLFRSLSSFTRAGTWTRAVWLWDLCLYCLSHTRGFVAEESSVVTWLRKSAQPTHPPPRPCRVSWKLWCVLQGQLLHVWVLPLSFPCMFDEGICAA